MSNHRLRPQKTNIMRTLLLIILIATAGITSLKAQTKNFIDQPYIETSAKVDTAVTPDKIWLSIFIAEKDTKGKLSVEEQENKMAKVLKSLGIDLKEQLKLTDLSSNFKKYFLRSQDVLKSKSYSLVVYDALTAGKVIAGLEKIKISNVELEKTEYSKLEQLKLELRSKAVQKAKRQAEAMVQPLGQKPGAAIFISDGNSYSINYAKGRSRMEMSYAAAPVADEEPLAVDFEKIKVISQVSAKFKLE